MQYASDIRMDYEKAHFAAEEFLDLQDRSLRALKVRRALAELDGRSPRRLLDLGCGEGALSRTLERLFPNAEVHACDTSAAQLERAKARSGGVIFRQCGQELPYEDGLFDAILVLDVLEHVPQAQQTVAEIARVLRKGGLLLLHCPCEGQVGTLHWACWKLRIGADLKRNVAGHVQRFTRRRLIAMIERAGLKCARIRYGYHLFGQLYDLVAFYRQQCSGKVAAGKSTWVERLMVCVPWYRIFPKCEWVACLESSVLGWFPLAMGIDACFVKQ